MSYYCWIQLSCLLEMLQTTTLYETHFQFLATSLHFRHCRFSMPSICPGISYQHCWYFGKFQQIIQLFLRWQYSCLLIVSFSSNCSLEKFQCVCVPEHFCVYIQCIPHTFLIHQKDDTTFQKFPIPIHYQVTIYWSLPVWIAEYSVFINYLTLSHHQLSICAFSSAYRLCSNSRARRQRLTSPATAVPWGSG